MKDNALKIRNTSLILAIIASVFALARIIVCSLFPDGITITTVFSGFTEIEPALIFVVVLLIFHKNGRAISWMPFVYLLYFLNLLWSQILIYKTFANSILSQTVSFFSFAYINMFNFILLSLPGFICLIAAVLAFFKRSPTVFLSIVLGYYVFYFIIAVINAFKLLTPPPEYMSREVFLALDVYPVVNGLLEFSSKIIAFAAYLYYTIKTTEKNKDAVSE